MGLSLKSHVLHAVQPSDDNSTMSPPLDPAPPNSNEHLPLPSAQHQSPSNHSGLDGACRSAPTMLKNWRLRFIVLDPSEHTIRWFKAVDAAEAQGELDLAQPHADVTAAVVHGAADEGAPTGRAQLCVRAGPRRLVLEAENGDVIEQWRQAIKAVIEASRLTFATASCETSKKSCVLL